jgi:anaerobic selenocysteine-containing dehydrogenase
MMNVIIDESLVDREFIDQYTTGFVELAEHVKTYTPEKTSRICGVPVEQIYQISRMFAKAGSACIEQGINTLDQHINGFQTSRCLAILQAITGNFNKPGAWCINPFARLTDLRLPVEGEPIGASEHPIFRSFWGRTSPYGQQMLLPDVLLSGKPYPIKAMLVSGGNPAAAWPDSAKIKEALDQLDLLVVMDLFMTDTAKQAHVVLPVCSSLETVGIAYNYGLTMGIPFMMLSRKVIDPVGESKPDWWIYSRLGEKMGYGQYFPWQSDREVVSHMLEPSGVTLEQLESDDQVGVMFGRRSYEPPKKIKTPSQKIELYSQSLAEMGQDPLPRHIEPSQSPVRVPELRKKYPYILVTGARIPEYTHWQMKNIPQLRKLAPDPMAWINPRTARESGVSDGEMIEVKTRRGSVKVRASVTEDMMPDVVSLSHGWEGEVNSNLLVETDPRDPVTGYSEFRNVACSIGKTGD